MEFNSDKASDFKEQEFFQENAFSLDELRNARKRELNKKVAEIYFWILASMFFTVQPFLDFLDGARLSDVVARRFDNVLLSLVILVFPIVYNLIFNMYPLEALRRSVARNFSAEPNQADVSDKRAKAAEASVLTGTISGINLCNFSVAELLSLYATSSRDLSQGLYNRAGVYLLVGVIVAFAGLGFFYMETSKPTGLQGVELAIALVPKLGILFFIELVAFFFLRQYRSAMDEFRYYEAIKRKREETLAMIKLLAFREDGFDALELVSGGFFFSDGKVLNKDQSTEIIEARKLEKNEIEILEKIIDAVSRGKK